MAHLPEQTKFTPYLCWHNLRQDDLPRVLLNLVVLLAGLGLVVMLKKFFWRPD